MYNISICVFYMTLDEFNVNSLDGVKDTLKEWFEHYSHNPTLRQVSKDIQEFIDKEELNSTTNLVTPHGFVIKVKRVLTFPDIKKTSITHTLKVSLIRQKDNKEMESEIYPMSITDDDNYLDIVKGYMLSFVADLMSSGLQYIADDTPVKQALKKVDTYKPYFDMIYDCVDEKELMDCEIPYFLGKYKFSVHDVNSNSINGSLEV